MCAMRLSLVWVRAISVYRKSGWIFQSLGHLNAKVGL